MFRRLLTAFLLLTVVLVGGMFAILWPLLDATDRGPLSFALGGTVLLGGLLAVVLSGVLAAQVTRPLKELSRAVENMAQGVEQPPRVSTERRDEVSRLGRTFNAMSETLSKRIEALEADRQQLRTILSGMVEGVVALDAGQRVLFVNERARELLELHGTVPVGQPVWEVARHPMLLESVRRALDSPRAQREELTWNGVTTRNLTVHAARLPGDPPRGAVLVLHDTTELRRLERLRQEFVANVSHELKTPLSVIKVCVETLLDGAMEDAKHGRQFLEQVSRQSDRLHALILDLLSLARIESGTELMDFDAVPVDAVVRGAVERQMARAEARCQQLEILPSPAGVEAWADEEALEQILENLLDNALKYTPEGGAIRVGWSTGEGQVRIEVADTGIGIPSTDLPRVFERFYRVDKARSREMGGTGLGLSIVKHLTQAMHGSVRAVSEVGLGTTFTVALPLAG